MTIIDLKTVWGARMKISDILKSTPALILLIGAITSFIRTPEAVKVTCRILKQLYKITESNNITKKGNSFADPTESVKQFD